MQNQKFIHEGLLALIITVISLLLYRDIYNPLYSFVGDEYAFFEKAKEIATSDLLHLNMLSQQGVYGYHPVLDSVFQGIIMKIFGTNLLGWKASNIIVVDISIILLFIISMLLFNNKLIALVSATFFGFSHYLLAFAHIGYNNLNALPPFLLSVVFLVRYLKYSKNSDSFLCGLFSGLCFYTFYSARLILFLTLPLILSSKLKGIFLYSLGFSILFIPFLLANGIDTIFTQTLSYPYSLDFSKLTYFLLGLFNERYVTPHHFVTGPLLNLILSIFLLVGLIAVLISLRAKMKFLLLMWFLLISVFIVMSFYKLEVPITRLHIVLPSISLIGAYGMVRSVRKVYIVSLLVFLYIISELVTFYINTPRVTALSGDSLLLNLGNDFKNKTVCILDNSPNPPILLLSNLYGVHNISVYNISSPVDENCDIITNLPHVDASKALVGLEPRSRPTNTEISSSEQESSILGAKVQKYIRKTYTYLAKINGLTYYEHQN